MTFLILFRPPTATSISCAHARFRQEGEEEEGEEGGEKNVVGEELETKEDQV